MGKRGEKLIQPKVRLSEVKLRPSELSRWLQTRKFGAIPDLASLPAYATQWIAWWNALQPEWRQAKQSGGLPLAITGRESRPLSGLRKGGPNGFVTILIGLKWWKGVENPNWIAAVNDVKCCLERCLVGQTVRKKVAGARGQKRKGK